MPTEAQLKESLKVLLKSKSLSATEDEVTRHFLSLARIAPTCMADPNIAAGFIATVMKAGGSLGPGLIGDTANAEKLMRELKVPELGIDESLTLSEQMDLFEKHLIERALQRHRKKGDVAKVLGIPQSTLSTKLKRYGLN